MIELICYIELSDNDLKMEWTLIGMVVPFNQRIHQAADAHCKASTDTISFSLFFLWNISVSVSQVNCECPMITPKSPPLRMPVNTDSELENNIICLIFQDGEKCVIMLPPLMCGDDVEVQAMILPESYDERTHA